jgi:hypothetical protein
LSSNVSPPADTTKRVTSARRPPSSVHSLSPARTSTSYERERGDTERVSAFATDVNVKNESRRTASLMARETTPDTVSARLLDSFAWPRDHPGSMNARFALPATISVAIAVGLRFWLESAGLEGAASFAVRVASLGASAGPLVLVTSLAAAGLLVLRSAELLKARAEAREALVFAVLAFVASAFVAVGGLMFGVPLLRGESPSYVYESGRLFSSTPFGLAFVVTGLSACVWTSAHGLTSSIAKALPARVAVALLSAIVWCGGLNVVAHFARGSAFFFERTGM